MDSVSNSDLWIMVAIIVVMIIINLIVDYVNAPYFGQERKIWFKRRNKK